MILDDSLAKVGQNMVQTNLAIAMASSTNLSKCAVLASILGYNNFEEPV